MGQTELYVLISIVIIVAIIYGRTFLITRSHKYSAYLALCIFGLIVIFLITHNIILIIILFIITVIIGIAFPWDYKNSGKNKND